MPSRRGKNLSDRDVEEIVRVIDGWTGKLSWEALIEAVQKRLYRTYTRQALHKHERIHLAFVGYKKRPRTPPEPEDDTPPDLRLAYDQVARLEAENRRLETENQRLLEQFARWAYNAHTRGLTAEFLNQPLPRVNRGQTPARKDK